MQAMEMLAKIFMREHRGHIRLTYRRDSWTAYKRTIRSWAGLESLLPEKLILERTEKNFGLFYLTVFRRLKHNADCKKYQRRMPPEQRRSYRKSRSKKCLGNEGAN